MNDDSKIITLQSSQCTITLTVLERLPSFGMYDESRLCDTF